MKTEVAIVIPNWNGAEFITDCLNSLVNQSMSSHVVVVDNGSTDESVSLIEGSFPGVELLKFEDNAGFSGGVNRGIKKLLDKFEYIILFNNDAVADPKWTENLVQSAKDKPEAGIITGKFLRLDKKSIDSTGDIYTVWGMPYPRGRNQSSKMYAKGEYVFAGTGGATLYRSSLFKEIGIFDEDFFAYFEDVDISFRAQLANWKVYYEPKAISYHHVSGTSSKLGNFSRYHSIKNFYLLWIKNMPWQLIAMYWPLFLLQSFRLVTTAIIRTRSPKTVLSSHIKVIKIMKSTLRKRSEIQNNRKVSLSYINSMLDKKPPPIIKKPVL